MTEQPFAIGDLYWKVCGTPEKVNVTCPVCAGHTWFQVTLGTGEVLNVECDACGLGAHRPTGYVTEYRRNPCAEPFRIAKVTSFSTSFDTPEWRVESDNGVSSAFGELRKTEEEALERAKELDVAQYERSMESRQHKRRSTSRAGWSVYYHRQQIKEAERSIAWHRSRIEAKKDGDA